MHLILQYQKITFLNIIRKVVKYWEAVQNSDFTRKFRFYYWQQIPPVVFLEVTGWLCPFSRKYLPNPGSE